METSSGPHEDILVLCAGSGLATSVCRKITGQLTSAIAQQEDVAVQLEALDILSDMLSRCRRPVWTRRPGMVVQEDKEGLRSTEPALTARQVLCLGLLNCTGSPVKENSFVPIL